MFWNFSVFYKEWQIDCHGLLFGNQHCFTCTICLKTLSCGHQDAADIQDHISTKSCPELAKAMATKSRHSHTFELCHIKN